MSTLNLNQLVKQSINAALDQDWTKASTLNQKILKNEPSNIDALNRLAKAKIELGDYTEAKSLLRKVLSQDKFNSIATNNLAKASKPTPTGTVNTHSANRQQTISFIEEPGKTMTASLVNIGERQVIDYIQSGEKVILCPLKRKIKVITQDKTYLGSLPEDISLTLARHIKLGSKFDAFVRFCSHKQVTVFIKEVKKSARLKGVAPFSPDKKDHSITLKHHTPMNTPLEIYDPESETED